MWVATSDSTIRHWSLPSNLGSIANNSNDSTGQHQHKPVVKVSLCKFLSPMKNDERPFIP